MSKDKELIATMNESLGGIAKDPVIIPVKKSRRKNTGAVDCLNETWEEARVRNEEVEKGIEEIVRKVKDSKIEERVQEIEKEKWENAEVHEADEEPKGEQYEQVNHPAHYNKYSVEVIEMFRRIYGDELTSKWCEMTALKYRMRMGTKPDNSLEQDLEKEKWYLNKAEQLKPKNLK